jgi:microcystin-dependent protein
MHPGQGPGLSLHDLGEAAGSDTITLLASEMPAHSHTVGAYGQNALQSVPGPSSVLARSNGAFAYVNTNTSLVQMDQSAIPPVGGSQPHNNLMPYLTLNFCIALQGVYPPRA